jgi:broad specificity phosphatase PhoE
MEASIMQPLNTKKAAKLIAEKTNKPISPQQVAHECKLGHLEGTLIGHAWAIMPDAIERYERRPSGPKPK